MFKNSNTGIRKISGHLHNDATSDEAKVMQR